MSFLTRRRDPDASHETSGWSSIVTCTSARSACDLAILPAATNGRGTAASILAATPATKATARPQR